MNDKAAPTFPVLVVSERYGPHSRKTESELKGASGAAIRSGYYESLDIFDSNSTRWKSIILNKYLYVPNNFEFFKVRALLSKLEPEIAYKSIGAFTIEEMIACITSRFDENNDFYAEMNISISRIQNIRKFERALKLFNFD